MYKIQNLTSRAIKFQGKIIAPYGSENFFQLSDYITLARLTNAGKATYTSVPTPTTQPVIKNETVIESTAEINNEKVVEDVVETVPEITDKQDEVVETVETVEESPVIEEKVEVKETKKAKRNRKQNND